MAVTLNPTEKQNAITGAGTLVGFSEDKETYTTLAGVTSIGAPSGENDEIDQTCIAEDSKRYLAGMFDGSEIAIEFHYYKGDASQKAVFEHAKKHTVLSWVYQFSNGTTITFDAVTKNCVNSDPSLDNTVKFTLNLKVNSLPVLEEPE